MTKPISSEINAVLDKLLNDDSFRAELLRDPVSTLASIGVAVDPSQVPAERSLPSKEIVSADQIAVSSKLESSLGMVPFIMYGNDRFDAPAKPRRQIA